MVQATIPLQRDVVFCFLILCEFVDPFTSVTVSPAQSVGLFRLAGDGMDCAELRDALDNGQKVRLRTKHKFRVRSAGRGRP